MLEIAVIGAGHWGPNLIRNFDNRNLSCVRWVVDSDRARLTEIGRRFPGVRLAEDPDVVFADDAVDAVVIATPTSTHYHLARTALRRGFHVLVEKPIATATIEAEELCLLAEDRGLVLMVGHVFLYNSGVQQVRKLLVEGHLGRLYYMSMVRTNLGPIRTDVNSGWDLASHDIAIANYWLQAEPIAASATGGTWINKGIEDTIFATLRYPDDVLVALHASWLNPRKARDITVVGELRMITLDDMNLSEPLRIYDKHVTHEAIDGIIDTFASFRASIREGSITIPKVPLGEPLKAECDHFLDCVSKGVPPLTAGRDSISIVRALEAIGRSAGNRGRAGHHDRLVEGEVIRSFVFTVTVDDPERICRWASIGHHWTSDPITACSILGEIEGHPTGTATPAGRLIGPTTYHQLSDALRAGAGGLLCTEAAVELLVKQQSWLNRHDFVSAFIERPAPTAQDSTGRPSPAFVDWLGALRALDVGRLACSGGEGRLLRIAGSLAEGIPVDLRDAITGLDSTNTGLVARALCHAAGHRHSHQGPPA